MIYIISEKRDMTTDLVVEWLISRGKSFTRFNNNDFVKSITTISNTEDHIGVFANAEKVWHRRGFHSVLPKEIFEDYANREDYVRYVSKEAMRLINYQEYKLKENLKENYIGSLMQESHNNKLVNLSIAKDVGFKIPNTLITNNRGELLAFYEKFAPLITKDLRVPVSITTRNKHILSTGVKQINETHIRKLNDTFVPIFLQQYVPKKYEIRIFVVCQQLFCMAIFSQRDEQTKIDYRNYNQLKPNRCVPVKLPAEVTAKVWAFMDKAEMNTGSIDLIVTPKNEYYFLEINPMGQFHWLSQNCNFYVERAIAKFLCDEKT